MCSRAECSIVDCDGNKILQPQTEFYKNNRYSDGLDCKCKTCAKMYARKNRSYEKSRKYAIANRDRINERRRERRIESDKEREYARDRYAKNKTKIRKTRNEKYAQRYYQTAKRYYGNNADKIKERTSAYKKTERGRRVSIESFHRRRDRINATINDLTASEWDEIIEKQENKCARCNGTFDVSTPPTIDHIVPVSKGGPTTKNNIQALCGKCNSAKGVRVIRY